VIVLDHAPYAPFMEPRAARPPGLSPLDMRDWTVRLPDFEAQMAYRRRLLAEQPEVVLGALHEGEEPALELLEMLLAHLGEPRPLTHEERFCALTAIGRLVPEDFCLLVPDPASGEYRLVAAVLCFPSRWLLAEKLGRPLTPIHTPVPDYAGTLSRRVNRVFEALLPDRPLVRVNWTVQPTAELFLPQSEAVKGGPAGPGTPGPFYLRTERQTLVRLPRTGAVAFGIKTSVTPVERLSPPVAAGLAQALRALGDGMVAYKGGRARVDAAVARLDEIACAGTAPTSSLA
jgi:dimethylamine monooxygenase subunit A